MSRVVSAASVLAVLGLLALGACARQEASDESPIGMHEAIEADRKIKSCLAKDGWDDSLEGAVLRRLEDPQFDAAVRKCATELGIEVPEPGDTVRALNEIRSQKIACMRDKGWPVPEPSTDAQGLIRTDHLAESVPADKLDEFREDFARCGPSG
jgi:hypothetical protein